MSLNIGCRPVTGELDAGLVGGDGEGAWRGDRVEARLEAFHRSTRRIGKI